MASSGPLKSRSISSDITAPCVGQVFNDGQSCGSHSNRALASRAFGGCLRSKSALALSSSARASLRYRTTRELLMASQIPSQPTRVASNDVVSSRSGRCCRGRRGEPDQPLVNASCDVGLAGFAERILAPLSPAARPSVRRPNRNPLRMNGIRFRVAEIAS